MPPVTTNINGVKISPQQFAKINQFGKKLANFAREVKGIKPAVSHELKSHPENQHTRDAKDRFAPYTEWMLSLDTTLVPLRDGTKRPFGKWSISDPTTNGDSLEATLQQNQNCNLGIIIKNGLFVLDFDKEGSYKRFKESYPKLRTTVVKSGRETGGYHVYVFCRGYEQRKFDLYLDSDDQKSGEVLGNGYVCAPGSLHESGQEYSVLNGHVGIIAEVSHDFLDSFRKKTDTVKSTEPTKPEEQQEVMVTDGLDDGLKQKMGNLPYKGLSLKKKLRIIPNNRKHLVTERVCVCDDDYSRADYQAAMACQYAGITEDEFVAVARMYPDGLGARFNHKQKKDENFEYLRRDYRKCLSTLDLEKVMSTAKKNNGLRNAREAKAAKPKSSKKDRLIKYIRDKENKSKVKGQATLLNLRDSKIFGNNDQILFLVEPLIEEGSLEWADNKQKTLRIPVEGQELTGLDREIAECDFFSDD